MWRCILFNISFFILTSIYLLELSTPVCSGEVRRWSHGGYTLLHDGEAAQAEYALDLVLPFGWAGLCPTTLSSFHICTKNLQVNIRLSLCLELSFNRMAVRIWWLHMLCRQWRGWGGKGNHCLMYSVHWCMHYICLLLTTLFFSLHSFWLYIRKIIPWPSFTETKKPWNLSNMSTIGAALWVVTPETYMTFPLCIMNKSIFSVSFI